MSSELHENLPSPRNDSAVQGEARKSPALQGSRSAMAASPGMYWAMVFSGLLLVLAGAALGPDQNPRIAYLCTLVALCASPLLLDKRANGPCALLYMFMALYFLSFAVEDLFGLVEQGPPAVATGLLSEAELVILAGGMLTVLGYWAAIAPKGRIAVPRPPRNWRSGTLLALGLAIWVVGIVSTWIWQMDILARAFDQMQKASQLELLVVTIGRQIHLLGLGLLAYAFITSGGRLLAAVILTVIAVEFVIGFVGDSKEISMLPIVVVLMTKFLLQGRVPKLWMVTAGLIAVLSFPVFQAYRLKVLEEQGITRTQAALDIGKELDIALHANAKLEDDPALSQRSFVTRVSYKSIIELVTDVVGTKYPYQRGKTYAPILTSFVPRFIWPDKPDASMGQYFDRELHITEAGENYISPTFLGEFYWNFGWLGVIAGMLVFGYSLGLINRLSDLSRTQTVTKFLILTVSAYTFCFSFQQNIALSAVEWFRSVVVIVLMHFIFGRRIRVEQPDPGKLDTPAGTLIKPSTVFPNLMR